MLRPISLIALVIITWAGPVAAEPGFVADIGAEVAWPDGPQGAFNPVGEPEGVTYYVDGETGSDTGAGTSGDPFETIARGLDAAGAGDTVVVRAGTYHEQVAPPAMNPVPSRSGPLTLIAEPGGGEVIIDGTDVTPVTEGGLQNPAGVSLFQDGVIIIDGFIVQNFSGYGMAVQQSSSAVVRNCTFRDNGLELADSVDMVVISSRDVRVLGNTFDSATERAIDDRSTDTWIAHNYFTGHSNNAVKIGPYPAGLGCRVEHNAFFDNDAIQGVIYVHETRGVTVQRNLLVRGSLQAIRLDDVQDTMVFSNTAVGFQKGMEIYRLEGCRLEGNILASNTLGVEILSLMADSGLDGNLYFDNQADVDGQGDAGPCAMFEDPGFEDAAGDDYSLADGAWAIDRGPADLPVPLGGGDTVDAGAFEKGAGEAPWDYQTAGQVADFSPRITWTYVDSQAGTQAACRVQIDRVNTFDSVDLLDSNWVQDSQAGWIVPREFELAAGEWYVKIKTRDTDGNDGPWSDPNLRLVIEAPPDCASQGGVGCAVLDGCDGEWLVAVDDGRCCDGDCVPCPDADSDGFLDAACGGGDCDDSDPDINPDAEEDCEDGIDNDCDDDTDLDDSDCGCIDHDRDGYGENCAAGDDCDDTIASVHPGAEELCNYVDDDCDGSTDEGFDLDSDPENCGECGWACPGELVCDLGQCEEECGTGRSNCDRACIDTTSDLENCGGCGVICDYDNASEKCTDGVCVLTVCDQGWVDANGIDEDGCEYECTPSAEGVEECGNGVDDNCDGQIDENCDSGGCSCGPRVPAGRAAVLFIVLLLLVIACRTTRP